MVIDGAVRDVDDIRRLKFPVFAKATVPNAGEPKGLGEINAEISCCGQIVRPGDWIIGDESGVVVVPKERAYEVARRALEVKKTEERIREEIRRGSTLSQVSALCKVGEKEIVRILSTVMCQLKIFASSSVPPWERMRLTASSTWSTLMIRTAASFPLYA